MRDNKEVEVLEDVNDLVDDELALYPFYAEAYEELQAAEEDDVAKEAAEAAAEAAEEEWNAPEEGGEAGE
ncbi:unnamed protein product [Closterium sp. Yama58-4]|nr:unnamed protein product [Closterium sp. Yama58-4]